MVQDFYQSHFKDNKIESIENNVSHSQDLSDDYSAKIIHRLTKAFCQLSQDKRVHFQDVDSLKEKLIYFHNAPTKIQMVADFDRTISSFVSKSGSNSQTSFQVLHCYKPEVYKLVEKEKILREKYCKIEFSTTLSHEEKIPFMVEWWQKANDLIFNAGLCLEDVKTATIDSSLFLREGFCEIINRFTSKEVPVVIASAGLGDVIMEKMTKELGSLKHIKIISNFFKYNEKNVIVDLQGPVMHTYNKHLIFERESPYFSKFRDRTNIVLFGDSIGDVEMIKSFPWPLKTIKIGFINFDFEKHIDEYLDKYDIVVEDPSSAVALMPLIEFLFP